LDATALADVAGMVTLSASAGGGANDVEGGAGTASADPLIEIDPTYLLNHPGLTLEFSAGVGNGVAPVPLPSSLALLCSGLAAIVGWRRHQRRSGHDIGKQDIVRCAGAMFV
jgi:PEP-CTERM motif